MTYVGLWVVFSRVEQLPAFGCSFRKVVYLPNDLHRDMASTSARNIRTWSVLSLSGACAASSIDVKPRKLHPSAPLQGVGGQRPS